MKKDIRDFNDQKLRQAWKNYILPLQLLRSKVIAITHYSLQVTKVKAIDNNYFLVPTVK